MFMGIVTKAKLNKLFNEGDIVEDEKVTTRRGRVIKKPAQYRNKR
jgi:hypothetical protein